MLLLLRSTKTTVINKKILHQTIILLVKTLKIVRNKVNKEIKIIKNEQDLT